MSEKFKADRAYVSINGKKIIGLEDATMKSFKTPICDLIRQQAFEFLKREGKKPSTLLFADLGMKVMFVQECLAKLSEYDISPDGREEFEGMKIIDVTVTYGGGFQWGFGK